MRKINDLVAIAFFLVLFVVSKITGKNPFND